MNTQLFSAFLLITLILVLTPGPIVTLVISTGATRGTRAALMTVAGSTVGNAVLISAIAFGLNIVIEYTAAIFEVLRWAGAAYLIYLGIQAWRHAGRDVALTTAPSHGVYFRRGFFVAISNPKTIAFFTAFLPQFIDATLPAGHQLVVMCVVSVLMAGVTDSGWALMAAAGRNFFLRKANAKLLGRLSGLALIGGGVWLSLARRPG
ncbi:LysE family translocator [Pseudolabrys taiwanensis]|uniref:LysE family translocator n=1 Tax=Pseudolabrys taiwanensis TaxID=331696 RepID=A0A345ZT17_9HYPH|nr:LysE family translocator [Pseudolabrys taiwanensis]AXK80064.1 LysE family translocator [Pseudolabrys taiwanensis]